MASHLQKHHLVSGVVAVLLIWWVAQLTENGLRSRRPLVDVVVDEYQFDNLQPILPPSKNSTIDAITTASKSRSCSCENSDAPWDCCQRTIRSSHKMGYTLTRDLMRKIKLPSSSLLNILVTQRKRWELPATDHRDVVVVRDVYDALVSGYLYHQSGRECSLDAFGVPLREQFGINSTAYVSNMSTASSKRSRFFMSSDWEKYMNRTALEPSKQGRDLCTYLQEESVLDGMRVYMDVAFGRWYDGLSDTLDLMQLPVASTKMLFICYEELSDPDATAYTMRRMLEWLYPVEIGKDALPGYNDFQHATLADKKIGHGTSNGTETRVELKAIVAWLDEHLFNKMVATLQQKHGCPGYLPRAVDDRDPC
ncbi:hypothetical protein MPSEU_000932800 [Mayamaea pseudoterrestris]|nr:hypothetical protein MPSEU_000932800 [Mayamaea pseudoterrestris]